ncbi:hypothetical protein NPIL_666941, partial [Nephila pilipes]
RTSYYSVMNVLQSASGSSLFPYPSLFGVYCFTFQAPVLGSQLKDEGGKNCNCKYKGSSRSFYEGADCN